MKGRRRSSWGPGLLLAGVGLAVTATIGSANQNVVPISDAGSSQQAISADEVKPDECDAVPVTNRVSGNGVVAGTGANDLITGGPGPDTLTGLAGDDCILGYGGDDTIEGGIGIDVCVGGPGDDTFAGCETELQG